jgi:amidase
LLTSVVGPLAHSLSDVRFFIKTILEAEPWFYDPKVIELPWRESHVDSVKGRPLTLGLLRWDGVVKPQPPVARGLRMVEEALRAAGHELIEFDIPDPELANALPVYQFIT